MEISGTTRLIGLIGWPVAHSFSPRMHNAAARALGLNLAYVPLPVRPGAVAAAVRGLRALGFLGANVTIPHKEAVIAYLDEVTPAAQAIGAVNTITIGASASAQGEELPQTTANAGNARPQITTPTLQSPISNLPSLKGDNTDWQGFLADLAGREVPVTGRTCVILGAGGGARAVAYALAQEGGQVEICARRRAQAQALISSLAPHLPEGALSARPWPGRAQVGSGALIVNTTPVGMHPDEGDSPWPEGAPFPKDGFVYDLIYNPAETRLMAQAATAGCRTANGLGMLLHQGVLSFEAWTGIRPEIEIMKSAMIGREK